MTCIGGLESRVWSCHLLAFKFLMPTTLRAQNKMREASPAVSARMVAPTILGQHCWVRWPYLQEAVVQAVSDAAERVRTALSPVQALYCLSWQHAAMNSCSLPASTAADTQPF